MSFERVRPNTPLLWALMVPAAAYLAWQYYWPRFTGDDLVDGMTGIFLGLFICSRPAANGIDLIFLERGAFKRIVSNRSGIGWFLLNGFVMVLGWFVISVGAARLTPPVVQRPVVGPDEGQSSRLGGPYGLISTSSMATRSGPSIIAARRLPHG